MDSLTETIAPVEQSTPTPKNNNSKAILTIGILFFVFGFVTWVNSVLIPYLKLSCQLSNFDAYLVAFAFYISYLVMAIPSGLVLKKTGFKNGMSLGLFVMACGALVFIPAALTRTFGLFLTGLFVQGTGLALLQTASNPYITILGPIETAAKRISIMGICNKVAGSLAPIILGSITLKNIDNIKQQITVMNDAAKTTLLDELAHRVLLPYAFMAVVLVGLGIMISFSKLPEINTDGEDSNDPGAETAKTSVFQFPHLLLGVLTLFMYVGAEVIAGDTIISYGASQGIALSTAKFFTTCTLLCMIVGYIVGIVCIPKYFTQKVAMQVSAILGLVLVVAAANTHGYLSVLCVALLGLANSLMWPAIWPLAIAGLGRFTKTGASMLVMAIAGGAVLPLVYGYLADKVNPTQAYWMLFPCYLVILYYAIRGHKIKQPVAAR